MPGFMGSWKVSCKKRPLSHSGKPSGQRSSTHPNPGVTLRGGLECARGLAFGLKGRTNPPEEGHEGHA